MEKRILAVLIAMLAGGAYAQSNYQTSSEVPKSTATQPPGATARIANPPPAPGYVGTGAGRARPCRSRRSPKRPSRRLRRSPRQRLS